MERITSSVTSVSWIPSEAIPGLYKLGFVLGVGHYDAPPPGHIDDLEAMRAADQFRFANRLEAYVDVDDAGDIVDAGYLGGGLMGSTTVTVGRLSHTIPGVAFPDIRRPVEHGDGRARFVQTTGGRTGSAMPRQVNRPPYLKFTASTVWTTLELTLHADGRAEHRVVGASPFPRHWIYDDTGSLVLKSGTADFARWMGDSFGDRDPWSDYNLEAVVADAESALERELSALIMQGDTRPRMRRLKPGERLVEQNELGDELYLVLDGMFSIEIDGASVAEVGPGAIVGERAALEGGARTATLTAVTPCRVAVADADQVDRAVLEELSQMHRREDEEPRPVG